MGGGTLGIVGGRGLLTCFVWGIGGFGLVRGGRVGGLLRLVGGRSTRMGGLLSFGRLGCTGNLIN